MWASDTPRFTLAGEKYDQSTYGGRFLHMMNVCDPFTIRYSQSQVQTAIDNLNKFKHLGDKAGLSDAELWHCRKLKESAVHPDTGEFIPLPFRMGGYVAFNAPVSLALIVAQKTPWILFYQWVNQSQNALVNYYNRNASSTVSDTTLVKSYLGAVGSAMTISYGLSRLVKSTISPPSRAMSLLRFIALPTSAAASSVNCMLMRWPETESGISVFDTSGTEIGKSKIAAQKAIKETVISRMLLQLPVFLLPPLLTVLPPLKQVIQRNPRLGTPITAGVMLLCFGVGLPASVAAFPQKGVLREADAEPFLKTKGDLFYNRGL